MYDQDFNNIDKQQFLSSYWQKKPCVFRSAFIDYPNYLSPDELAGLSLEPDVESRLIKKDPTTNRWTMEHGPLDQQVFTHLADSHWTLLVQSVDHWIPECRDLLKHFSFIPKWRFDDLMVSYAADQGSVGPHFDDFDVFLIQGIGTRRWRVGRAGTANIQSEIIPGLCQMDDLETMIDIELTAGDMLYIPPKTGHWGVSNGESVGYSVGYRSPETRQLLSLITTYMQESTKSSEFFCDPYRNSPSHHNQLEPELTQWAQIQLQKLSQQPELINKLLCRQLSLSKLGFVNEEYTVNNQRLKETSQIQLNNQLSIIWRQQSDKIVLSIEGEDFIFEKVLITAIEKLANFELCPINLFKKSPNTVDFPEDLSSLVDRGYVNIIT